MRKEKGTINGKMTYEFPAPGIVLNVMTGHFATDLADFCIAGWTEGLKQHPPLIMFCNWEAMTGYDPDCRRRLTDWHKQHAKDIEKGHILLKSKLVAMGVSVANMVLGGSAIETYSNKTKFEMAMRVAMKR